MAYTVRARPTSPILRNGGDALAPSPARDIPRDPGELVARFREILQGEEKSRWTVKQYSFFAEHFLEHVGKPLDEVTPRDLEAYREHLVLTRHYSKNSVYGTLRGLSCLFRSFGLSTAEALEVPRRPARLPNFLTEEEAHRLLETQAGHPRNRALLYVLGYGGLRVSEACHLDLDDVDLENQVLRVRAGKGDKDRMVVIEERTVQALREWLPVRAEMASGDTRLFPVSTETVERVVRKAAEEAGITRKVTPHTLRHTLATTLLKRGLDIRFIQKQLGHASVATTQVYTHVDTEALKDAYRAARPTY